MIPTTERPRALTAAYYSISEAAAALGVSRVSIWRWIRAGRLRVARLGHRTVRIARQDLEQLVAARLTTSGDNDDDQLAPRSTWTGGSAEHLVQFYENDSFLVDALVEFIGAALHDGGVGIVVATLSHRSALDERLQAAGLDLAVLRASGQYVVLDAADTLAQFMVGGWPDADRFAETIGGLVARAAETSGQVRIFGEMVALLVAEGKQAAALRLEALWSQLQERLPFSLLCAYPMQGLGQEGLVHLVGDVCAEHSRVIPAESYTVLTTADDRRRAIAALQQKAQALEVEIAERRQAEARLELALAAEREARQAAEAALRLRDEFLSIASHELKTPLSTLAIQAQLVRRRYRLEGQIEPERVVRALDGISSQVDKLSRLLDRLLDVSKIQAGKLVVERQPTDLGGLVEQVASAARALSTAHRISLDVAASVQADVDPVRLEQVMTNLLDNAIKYSPDGGDIEVVLAQTYPDAVELSVRDHGLGIPLDKRGHIFERFYQAHGASRSGMGLGLYVSREIVQLHGGEIRAEFPEDGGTRFVVRLPLLVPELAAA